MQLGHLHEQTRECGPAIELNLVEILLVKIAFAQVKVAVGPEIALHLAGEHGQEAFGEMLHVETSLERAVDLGVGYNVGDVACESEAHTLAYGCETRDVDGRTVEVRAVDFGGGQELEAVEAHAVIARRAFGHIEQHLKRRDGILGRTIGASETHGA